MSLQAVTVSILREVRTGDGAGGKAVSLTTVASGVSAGVNFYRTTSETRLETATGSVSGPGVLTQTKRLVTFLPPFPDVRVNDRIAVANGATYVVQFVRTYAQTLQVDVEVVA